MARGQTSVDQGPPDYAVAIDQHRRYIAALHECGLEVLVLGADEAYPDSTFIEDTALLLPDCAVITRPGAPTRRGETAAIHRVLRPFFPRMESITAPGTLDGGDILQVGRHYFIGLSNRTNRAGAEQLKAILASVGMSASTVPVRQVLHLKTGVTWVAERTLLATGEFIDYAGFSSFTILPVGGDQAGAANCLAINGSVLMPAGFSSVRQLLLSRGLRVIEVNISEFTKLDGGLTCLSLRL
jgi:dimethylargininase